MKNGCVDFNVNTLAYYNNNWWYVINGHVDFTANTIAKNEKGLWYVNNGVVDFGYNGTFDGLDEMCIRDRVYSKTYISK